MSVHWQIQAERARTRLDVLCREMRLGQAELEALVTQVAQQDEDALALQRYTQQDDGRIKELMLKIEKLTKEVKHKRRQLDNEFTETTMAQIQLTKTTEEFWLLHQERQDIVRQWELTIKRMRHRDKEIDQCLMEVEEARHLVQERKESIKEKQEFLQHEVENNRELEHNEAAEQRLAKRLHGERQAQEQVQQQLQDDLNSMKRMAEQMATELEVARTHVSHLRKDVDKQKKRLQKIIEAQAAAQQRLKQCLKHAKGSEGQAIDLRVTLTAQEKEFAETEKRLAEGGQDAVRRAQELHDVQQRERTLEGEIQCARATLRGLVAQLHKQQDNVLVQQEHVYKQDYQLEELARRLAHLQGDVSHTEQHELEMKVAQLTKVLHERNETHTFVSAQLQHTQDDIFRTCQTIDRIQKEETELQNKLKELDLFNDITEKEMAQLVHEKQEALVEERLVAATCGRLRTALAGQAHGVADLRKQKIKMQAEAAERQSMNQKREQLLNSQMINVKNHVQALSHELNETLMKVQKMRNRYELLMRKMSGSDGEKKSQAYYITKAAEAKEELKNEGDQLDTKVHKAEQELVAMKNTVGMIKGCNRVYRQMASRPVTGSEEREEQSKLEEKQRAVDNQLCLKQQQIRDLHQDLEAMQETMGKVAIEEAEEQAVKEQAEAQLAKLNKELQQQQEKLQRVHKQAGLSLPTTSSNTGRRASRSRSSGHSSITSGRSSGSFQTVMPLKNVDPGLELQASQDRPAQHTPSGGTHRRCSPRVAQQSGVQCASKGSASGSGHRLYS
uniref:Coiled-coil domain-containing protein 39 n=1 Tax=Eptatretus burgeri TaxID=7764 RepID=A0A8C4Q841_EPTBU